MQMFDPKFAQSPERLYCLAATPATVESGVRSIHGIAAVTDFPDRLKRVHLKGAYGSEPFQVPLLAFHNDEKPIGTAQMKPFDDHLEYRASFVKDNETAEEVKKLIRDMQGVMGVSIGWAPSDKTYYDEVTGHIIYPEVAVVELSVVPVPAQTKVLLQVASMIKGSEAAEELTTIIAATRSRNMAASKTEAMQHVHDITVAYGAGCYDDTGEPDDSAAKFRMDLGVLELEAEFIDL